MPGRYIAYKLSDVFLLFVFVLVVFFLLLVPNLFKIFIYFILCFRTPMERLLPGGRGGWARAAGGREACQLLEGSRALGPAGRSCLGPPLGGATCALVLRVGKGGGFACFCFSFTLKAALRGGGALLAVAERARLHFPQAERMSDGKCIV